MIRCEVVSWTDETGMFLRRSWAVVAIAQHPIYHILVTHDAAACLGIVLLLWSSVVGWLGFDG
jgi:hypothetical protein